MMYYYFQLKLKICNNGGRRRRTSSSSSSSSIEVAGAAWHCSNKKEKKTLFIDMGNTGSSEQAGVSMRTAMERCGSEKKMYDECFKELVGGVLNAPSSADDDRCLGEFELYRVCMLKEFERRVRAKKE